MEYCLRKYLDGDIILRCSQLVPGTFTSFFLCFSTSKSIKQGGEENTHTHTHPASMHTFLHCSSGWSRTRWVTKRDSELLILPPVVLEIAHAPHCAWLYVVGGRD